MVQRSAPTEFGLSGFVKKALRGVGQHTRKPPPVPRRGLTIDRSGLWLRLRLKLVGSG
jgi:hypothetical protein